MNFNSAIADINSNILRIPELAEDEAFISNLKDHVKVLLSKNQKIININIANSQETDSYPYTYDRVAIVLYGLSDPDDNVNFLNAFVDMLVIFLNENLLDSTIANTIPLLNSYLQVTLDIFNLVVPPAEMELSILEEGGLVPLSSGSVNSNMSTSDGMNRSNGWMSWSGVDATVVAVTKNGKIFRCLPEIQTISFSIQRDKFDVGGLGSVTRKGHTSGRRTVAGSIIGVVLKDEPLKHLQPDDILTEKHLEPKGPDVNPYVEYFLPDQLEDFDLILSLQNEAGHQARIAIFGVTIMNVGQTVSIQDLQTEIVYSYSADDIDLFSYEGKSGELSNNQFTSMFDIAAEVLRTRKALINGGVSIHASPFATTNFWTVIDKKTGNMLDVIDQVQRNPLKKTSDPDYNFKKSYYSGSSALVYFNHIWIPDVTSIAYNGTPQDSPIFGYSSENFDAVTKGNYIVNGSISMNFIRTGYINQILRLMWQDMNVFRSEAKDTTKNDYLDMSSKILERHHMTNIADFILYEHDNKYSLSETLYEKRNTDQYSSRIKYDIDAYREALRNLIWKPDKKQMDLYPLYRPDQATAARVFYTEKDGKKIEHAVPPLDIYIVFGNPLGDEYEVKKLCDVRFTTYSQTVQDDGTPIQEVNGFIARDIDAPSIDEMVALGLTDGSEKGNETNIEAVNTAIIQDEDGEDPNDRNLDGVE